MKKETNGWRSSRTWMVSIILILIMGAGLASSGVCIQTTETVEQDFFELQEEEKKLTQKNMGTLLLSMIFIKDHEVKSFLFNVIHHLQQKGELTENEVQEIANDMGYNGIRIFLFCKVNICNGGFMFLFPGTILSCFTTIPIPSLVLIQHGSTDINYDDHGYAISISIGFYGQAYQYMHSRNVWIHKVNGISLLTILLPD